eukprot:4844258-Pyramimonas_sp.AAC.1
MQGHFPELEDTNRVTAIFHGASQVYKFRFSAEDDAKSFHTNLHDISMGWVDFRDQNKCPLRVRGDLPLHARQKKTCVLGPSMSASLPS